MRKLIIFLVRKRLGLKKRERFKFTNQKSSNVVYYFTDTDLMKETYFKSDYKEVGLSGVSLNWLLDENCSIEVVKK